MSTRFHRRLAVVQISAALIATSAAVAQVPIVVPTPEEIIGHPVGASGRLAPWNLIVTYFERLAQASPKVSLERIGVTALGKPMIMAIITDEANQARLDGVREVQARLADPRTIEPGEMNGLIASHPSVAFIGASLHGNEIMATQMSMELAYDLATDPDLARHLENVVVLLVPGMNPDGLDITRGWWLTTRGTEQDNAPLPWLYHHYTGHDNNRDFFMVTQPETEAVTRVLYERWFPQVVYDVHQMGNRGARLFIPPFDDPLNPNIDPLIVRQTNVVGTQMALALTAAGKTGVTHQQRFDLWWHGGARTVPARHNMVGILSEAASTSYGDPIRQSPADLEQPEVGSMYPEPWEGGEWRPRDIVEYELIAAKALVRLLDQQRDEFLGNFVEVGRRQVARGSNEAPYAFIVPAGQRDPGTVRELVSVLRRGGVEVAFATDDFTVGGRTFPAASYVISMAQPYRSHAKDLLEPQRYPERRAYPGGPPVPPYDLSGWSLPMQMGVEVVAVDSPLPSVDFVPVDAPVVDPGRFETPRGSLEAVALDPAVNVTYQAIHEALRTGGRVTFSAAPIEAAWAGGARMLPAGTPVISGMVDLFRRARLWALEGGLDVWGMPAPVAGMTIDRLRVALYKPWTASIDEGWTRWVFEEWGVPFDTIHDSRIRSGGLGLEYDAIVVPSMTNRQIMEGAPNAHPDYAGGLGDEGAAALREFVEAGGTLILLDAASEFAIAELGVPVRNVESAQDADDPDRWYAPGSLLRVEWDTGHPIAAGMPEESAIFYARSPVFEVEEGATGVEVIARYPESDLLMSGYAQSEDRIAGRAALVEARVGAGRVVMFGFRPQHRAQPHLTFKPLFNALYRR